MNLITSHIRMCAQGELTADVAVGVVFGAVTALVMSCLVPWIAHVSRPFLGVRNPTMQPCLHISMSSRACPTWHMSAGNGPHCGKVMKLHTTLQDVTLWFSYEGGQHVCQCGTACHGGRLGPRLCLVPVESASDAGANQSTISRGNLVHVRLLGRLLWARCCWARRWQLAGPHAPRCPTATPFPSASWCSTCTPWGRTAGCR